MAHFLLLRVIIKLVTLMTTVILLHGQHYTCHLTLCPYEGSKPPLIRSSSLLMR